MGNKQSQEIIQHLRDMLRRLSCKIYKEQEQDHAHRGSQ